jgi:hypothetical protein
MGLRQVLFLAEVLFVSVEVPGFLSGLEVVDPEVKSCGVLPAISGRAGSETDSASDRHAVARRGPAPWDFLPRGLDRCTTCARAVTPRPIGPGPMILCGNRGGCPIFMRSWLVTKGSVAIPSWAKYATDPPPHF